MNIEQLQDQYRRGISVQDALFSLRKKALEGSFRNAWIHLCSEEELIHWIEKLPAQQSTDYPLYGIPFAIKDNIDLAGIPTTAACPGFSYTPEKSAYVVDKLIKAGAIPFGKTNLDQFATGLVGTRSPFGPGLNVIDPEYTSGGSSSGSAISVTNEEVLFSLGTDTAGSGRVPAAYQGIIGLKPTRGFLSCTGVVPACKSLDCVSIFTRHHEDLARILKVCGQYDKKDIYSRPHEYFPALEQPRIGVPQSVQLEFFGNAHYAKAFDQVLEVLLKIFEAKEVDYSVFKETAEILYGGSWVAERYAAIESYLDKQPTDMDPSVETIIRGAETKTASDCFKGLYKLEANRRKVQSVWKKIDLLITPTVGTHYRIDEINKDPIALNNNLGYYTNHMNLLDLCGLAIPVGTVPHPTHENKRLPFGITIQAPKFQEETLFSFAKKLQYKLPPEGEL